MAGLLEYLIDLVLKLPLDWPQLHQQRFQVEQILVQVETLPIRQTLAFQTEHHVEMELSEVLQHQHVLAVVVVDALLKLLLMHFLR